MTHDERIEAMARALFLEDIEGAATWEECGSWLATNYRRMATAAFAAAGVEEMVIAAAPDMLQEIATLRAELAEARRDVAELLALADITVQVEHRAQRTAEIRKRYGLDAAIDAARGEP